MNDEDLRHRRTKAIVGIMLQGWMCTNTGTIPGWQFEKRMPELGLILLCTFETINGIYGGRFSTRRFSPDGRIQHHYEEHVVVEDVVSRLPGFELTVQTLFGLISEGAFNNVAV